MAKSEKKSREKRVFKWFEQKAPEYRFRFGGWQEKRLAKLQARNVTASANFEREFRKLVLPYWKKYGIKPDKNAFKVFCEGKTVDPRYISNEIWQTDITMHFNNIVSYRNLGDKNLQPFFVPTLNKAKTLARSIFGTYRDEQFLPMDAARLCTVCREAGDVVLKLSYLSSCGDGIRFFHMDDWSDEDFCATLSEIRDDFVLQTVIHQHPTLASINPSINTIRILTFRFRGEVHVLSAVLRMGSGDSKVDNVAKGGFACPVQSDGRLSKYAVSRVSKTNAVHPSGVVFADVVIPNYAHVLEKVKEAADNMPYFNLLGWDIAIGEDGEPIFIEFNVRPEQNQKTCGPSFGDLTEDVLDEVFGKKD